MRAAIGLIVLGLVGGVVPTGLSGFTHAAQVLAGTAGALISLVICCLGAGAAARAISAWALSPSRVQPRRPVVVTRSAPRTI
jgi:hypothetical protein